ncbi:MAG: hypothetical protein ACRC9Y_18600 [Aeromonas veronii]
MKKSKWMKPICNDQMMGMNHALINELKRSCQSYMVYGNEAFIDTEVVIHGYREVGTALEVSVEARWSVRGTNHTSIRFVNVVF